DEVVPSTSVSIDQIDEMINKAHLEMMKRFIGPIEMALAGDDGDEELDEEDAANEAEIRHQLLTLYPVLIGKKTATHKELIMYGLYLRKLEDDGYFASFTEDC